MLNNSENERQEISDDLKKVDGYLDCEKINIHNIKRQPGSLI
jgi:hypothetical protein